MNELDVDDTVSPFGGGAPEAGDWHCPVCGVPTPHEFRPGRKRVYCTNSCRQKAYRWRRAHGVRLLVTPWQPAARSHNARTHAVRPAADYVSGPADQHGRNVAVCGAFARAAVPVAGWHVEFVPGAPRTCGSCTRLIGADPAWLREYPVIGLDGRGYPTVYRPPEQRRADHVAQQRPSGRAA